MKSSFRSIPILLLTAMIWGFAFVAQVDGVNYIGSFTMNGVRYALGQSVYMLARCRKKSQAFAYMKLQAL